MYAASRALEVGSDLLVGRRGFAVELAVGGERRRIQLGGQQGQGARLSSWGFWRELVRQLARLLVGWRVSCRGRCLGSRLSHRIGLRAGWDDVSWIGKCLVGRRNDLLGRGRFGVGLECQPFWKI